MPQHKTENQTLTKGKVSDIRPDVKLVSIKIGHFNHEGSSLMRTVIMALLAFLFWVCCCFRTRWTDEDGLWYGVSVGDEHHQLHPKLDPCSCDLRQPWLLNWVCHRCCSACSLVYVRIYRWTKHLSKVNVITCVWWYSSLLLTWKVDVTTTQFCAFLYYCISANACTTFVAWINNNHIWRFCNIFMIIV